MALAGPLYRARVAIAYNIIPRTVSFRRIRSDSTTRGYGYPGLHSLLRGSTVRLPRGIVGVDGNAGQEKTCGEVRSRPPGASREYFDA